MAKKILVIDDEELITKSLLKLLSRQSYNVIVVRSGSEAMDKVKETDFDLIVCDIRMPQLDGIETITQIRVYLKKSNKKSIPEILITGYADLEKYQKAIELKVAGYINKPFDTAEFLRVVKKVIG